MSALAVWEKIQDPIKEKIGTTTYDTWFSSLQAKAKDEKTLILETPDEFFKNWIIEHYLSLIQDAITAASERGITVEFTVNNQLLKTQTHQQLEHFEKIFADDKPEKKDSVSLNSRFSFNNFVVGPSNRFACAASLAVAESPAKAYNPLFIYGQVGLGKTHLMQAIAHEIKQRYPDSNCCYISSEKFTNELIEAIRHKNTSQFRQKYRNMDVLLIDDIHFIAGKESTQEEFFHTFNTLHNNRKQIIISSDRPPREIANLEERLSSRFAWGLITDIQPPDFETRVAILRKKSEREPVDVPADVIDFIADQIKTNIRELEGALIRVVAYALLEDKKISLDMTKSVLKDMVKESIKIISVEMIQKSVAAFYNLPIEDLKNKRRSRNIILPRQVAMYLTRKLTNMSLPEIGGVFGGKDHTTVLHSFRKIEEDVKKNNELRNSIENLITGLKQ